MDAKKIGEVICEMRNEKNITQSDLAKKLKISEKMIAAWEAGMCIPEAKFIIPIAETLEISAIGLMNGRKEECDEHKEGIARNAIETMLTYNKKEIKRELKGRDNIAIGILSMLSLLSISICLLCNIVIDHQLTWSLIVSGSIILGWAILIAIIKLKEKGITIGMMLLSIGIIPYLFMIDSQVQSTGWLIPLGVPIAVMSIVFLWTIWIIFRFIKISIWNKFAILCFLAGCMTLVINLIARHYIGKTWFTVDVVINVLVEIILALVLVSIGQAAKAKKVPKVRKENKE